MGASPGVLDSSRRMRSTDDGKSSTKSDTSRVVLAQLLLPLLKNHAAQVLEAEAPDALGDGLTGVTRQEEAVGIGAGRQKGADERLPPRPSVSMHQQCSSRTHA